ncbi:DMT family transporter [Vibrio cidicii]|nr:DMT family transporter [Vibrio cidicii]
MTPASYAIVLLVVGNLLATLSDVAVKLIDGNVSPFQYMFLRQLFSLLVITPLWLMQRKTQRALAQPRITLARAHLILIGSGCMMVSITYLPLATANAVFYAAPLLMLPLSVWLLKERPSLAKVFGTMVGFVGVLVVLRPEQFHWAAGFALGTALTLAFFNVLVRKLPAEQTVVTTLWWTTLLSLPVSLLLALLYWQPLTPTLAAYIFASSVCILGYNGLAVAAYRKVPAGQIALAEYSGLLFVTLIGMYAFAEYPDRVTWAGILLIVLPLFPWQSVFAKLRHGRFAE